MTPLHRLDLNLFPVFEAIYREGSITAAADALHLTQPAVSHALARLRTALDDELFQRSRRGVRPTAMANQLIGPVRLALAQLQQGVDTSRHFEPGRLQETFRLSLRDMMEALLMPPLVQRCQAEAPEVRFNCLSISREKLVHELASGRIDLAADAWVAHDDSVIHEKVLEDDLVCLLRSEHPALSEAWDMQALLAWPHIQVSSREQGLGLEDQILARRGLRRRVQVRSAHYFSAAMMVASSDLLLSLPRSFALPISRELGLVMRPFPEASARLEYFLYWHRDQDSSPALAWLKQNLLQTIRAPGRVIPT